MTEDPTESPRQPLTAEDRRRLRNDAVHAVRRLSEALDQADEDAQALVARLQAAVEPLRATFSGEGTLTVGGTAGLVSPPGFGGNGSLSVGVHHVLQIADAVQMQDATSPVVASGGGAAIVTVTATGTGYAIPTGSGSGSVTVTGTATGSAPPETFQVTADDVPWILWQILLRLDDMANATKPGVTVGQVYDRLMPLLGILIALLPYLS